MEAVYSLVNIGVDPVDNNSTSVRADVADTDIASDGNEMTNIGRHFRCRLAH